MTKVEILTTGGTIASRPDPGTGAGTLRVGAAELLAAVPGLGKVAEVHPTEVCLLHSWDIGPSHWLDLAARVHRLAGEGTDGVVVTQGTDTLEETAFALELLTPGDVTVVVTGAMRLASEAGADGPANLLAATTVAADPASRGKGVLVVMNGEVHSARYATKIHTTSPGTFASPSLGPLATVDGSGVCWRCALSPMPVVPATGDLPDVPLVTAAAGMGDTLLRAIGDKDVAGLVVAGSGAGNLPATWQPAVADFVDRGTPVVLASRCVAGRVVPAYGDAGGGHTLTALGAVPAGDLSAPKARIALMLLAAAGRSVDDIRRWFAEHARATLV